MEEVTSGSQQTCEEAEKVDKMREEESKFEGGEIMPEDSTHPPEETAEYAESEYGDEDHTWDSEEPEYLWNKYLKGVKLHHDVVTARGRKARMAQPRRNCASNSDNKLVANPSHQSQPDTKTVLDTVPANENKVSYEERSEETEDSNEQPCEPSWANRSDEEGDNRVTPQHRGGKKKLRMRTAREVIHRITWDPDLPAENFTVGYLDRFVGLVEKPFLFFDWSDLASVDYDVLAIPQHRIVYFKYRDYKVWDKNQRVDLIFGSTETSKEVDIRELIQQIDEEFQQGQGATAGNQYDNDDDSDDDNVRVFLQCDDSVKQKMVQRESRNDRPNHFVAIRVTDPRIQEAVFQIKRHLLAKEPRLSDFLMPDGALHITLAMLSLDGTEQLAAAIRALELSREKLASYFAVDPPMTVALDGLATFNSYVLYAKVVAPPPFYAMHHDLLCHLREQGVKLAHDHDFVPHMTLLKLTRSRSRLLGCPYIDPFIYVEHKDAKFGVQACNNLHLCMIGEEKRFDGFYQSAAEVYFDQI